MTIPALRSTTNKLAIVGAGAVGSTLAYAALTRGTARTVALLDVNTQKVEAEVLDLQHGMMFIPPAEIVGSDDVEVCRGADVVVITAGAKQQPGQTRLDLAEATIGLTRKILPGLLEVAPDAIYIMVTNPVDIVTYAAQKISGLPRERVFGSGTVLDSSRLRAALALHCGVAVGNVHAYIAGEHGDSEIVLWSSATIGGVPLLEWQALPEYGELGEAERAAIAHEVVDSAYRIIAGKGATNYAVGLASTRIIEAVLKNEHRVLTVSSRLDDYYGIDDVCLSVPSVVDRRGVPEVLRVPLSDAEIAGLTASAASMRAVQKRFGL
ncbi:L-lactate dehydrogenase [Xylanimonas ulmi]|uniref:L-lactate dehydrogenase n=1 Tax=Xylanimonas ulmi TaxID=228973 RepID=A0A4Q7M242_9MICO|nr:L-lactate dehydrogenase [Xylanibacterium ulmi]RZS61321.1 L-lactate dehydrogenase [Xylanibacterium ulmi]